MLTCWIASYAEMNLSDVCEELNEIRDVFSFQNTSLGSLEQLSSPMVRPHDIMIEKNIIH